MTTEAPVVVEDYDLSWPERFADERLRLEPVLVAWLTGPIEHIGSTAVPGLAAKPVIDIMAPVASLDAARPAIQVLEKLDYRYYPYRADVMHWFCKPSPAVRTHHLHLVPYGSPLWLERLAFRDHLRANADVAAEYAALKRSLAEKYRLDREAYTDAKGPFIEQVLGELDSMALTATIYNFDIDLADADRGVYESLALRVACHPSESEEYLVTRVLAYALEWAEGIEFSKGLSDPSEPAISVRDLTGAIQAWIEIGNPDAARLHKASKATRRVVIYTHKDPMQVVGRLAGERIHRAEEIELWAIDRALVAGLVSRLERRMAFALSISDRELYISIGADTLSGAVTRYPFR